MNLTIHGEPAAKARARTVTKNGRTWSYTDEKTTAYESSIKAAWVEKFGAYEITLAPVRMIITFYLQAPKMLQKGHDLESVIAKGRKDVDNMSKCILDSLQGLTYQNDSQVYSLHAEKYYSLNPRTEVEIIV